MSNYKKITRASLYDSESDVEPTSDDNPTSYMPSNFDFEFIEVDNDKEQDNSKDNEQSESRAVHKGDDAEQNKDVHSDEEFDFPLFAAPTSSTKVNKVKDEDFIVDETVAERGRPQSKIMKVSLREDSVEKINNERPSSYYRATYSDKEKKQFFDAAVSGDDIYAQIQISCPISDPKPWKSLDLLVHNATVDKELQKQNKRSHSRRAGKKKRENKIGCRERKLERKKIEKKIQKEKDAKRKKQLFGKPGPFKPRSKRFNLNKGRPATGAKPKFRTE